MKRTLLSLAILMALTTAQSQSFRILSPDQTDSNGAELFQSESFHGKDVFLNRSDPFLMGHYDPGTFPEGDYLGEAAFSPDGQYTCLANRFTDMITVFDWSDTSIVANIQVGDYPSCVEYTNQYILAGCQFANKVYVINASNYQVVDSITTGEQPCRIHASDDGTTAYVACDIADVCTVIDLNSLTVSHTISNFPIYLQSFSWSTQSARNWAKYSDFLIAPGGTRLITHNGTDAILVFNAGTGNLSNTISVEEPRALAFSGDEGTVVCAANPSGIATVHSYSYPAFNLNNTVEVTGYQLATNGIVADQDGGKAYIGTTNNTSTLVRFATSDFITFSNTYTAFWLGVTHDHAYAIGGQYRFSIIDFENEVMTDQMQGFNQSWGVVSPTDYRVFAYDPLLLEAAHFYDISDPNNIDHWGYLFSGSQPEGDAPYRVAINEDYGYVITVNNLSNSCNILDFNTEDIIATIDLGESAYDVVTNIGQTPYVVCGGYNNNTVKVIDLDSLKVVAELNTGQRPMELTVHPYENIVYAANIKSNSISVLEIDGANSSVTATIPCGVIGVYTPFFGIRSGVEVSPDGKYLLVAASFDDQVKIIDTETNTIIKSLAVGDFPLAISITDDSKVACITNLFDFTFSLIVLDGINSGVSVTLGTGGEYPVDVTYKAGEDNFYICNYYSEDIAVVDARTGQYDHEINMAPYGGAWKMDFYDNEPVFLTVGNQTYGPAVVYRDSIFELPGSPSDMLLSDFLLDGVYAVTCTPGPDFVTMINLAITTAINFPLNQDEKPVSIYPNPFTDDLYISMEEKVCEFTIFDLKGAKVYHGKPQVNQFDVRPGPLTPGVYTIRFITASGNSISRKIVKKSALQ